MHLTTRNVNTAFRTLVDLFHNGYSLRDKGTTHHDDPWDRRLNAPLVKRSSRNGNVLMIDEPVTITYTHPRERVLFNAARDCNPFFHLYEALWMLAGRNDVAPVAYYAKQMKEFSDDGRTLNGAYGWRWRKARGTCSQDECCGDTGVDQLDILVNHLKADPHSRRAVLQMWNVEDDLLKIGLPRPGHKNSNRECPWSGEKADDFQYSDNPCTCRGTLDASKDVCCNLSVMFSLREETHDVDSGGVTPWMEPVDVPVTTRVLDMTVTNRSNDLVWGLLGTNYVHFTILQEYVAARLGAEVGKYHHFSNNLHVYDWNWKPDEWLSDKNDDTEPVYTNGDGSVEMMPLVKDPVAFERELPVVVRIFDGTRGDDRGRCKAPTEPFLRDVAWPMLSAHYAHKRKDHGTALEWCDKIAADDWRIAAKSWLERRAK